MHIIDRRLNPKGKNLPNIQRFFDRIRTILKDSVDQDIKDGSVKDVVDNDNVTIKNKIVVSQSSIREPAFHFDHKSGKFSFVLPGNQHFEENGFYLAPQPQFAQNASFRNYISCLKEGDKIGKPRGGSRGRGGDGATDGDGVDDFIFILSPDEYAQLMLEGLELPNREERIEDTETTALQRAGYTINGNPANLALVRTLKNSFGRRIGLQRPKPSELEELEEQLKDPNLSEDEVDAIVEQIETLKVRMERIPYIDPFDVRYNNYVPDPKPKFKAVMFCLMDVSGSMGEREKDLAKRFYMILYRFLRMKYEKVDVVFIRHHHTAKIVDEETFFYGTDSGGTIVSTAFEEMLSEVQKRYDPADWNIYVAQASDGDNSRGDMDKLMSMIVEQVLPIVNYMAYVQIGRNPEYANMYGEYYNRETDLWAGYKQLVAKQFKKFAMREVSDKKDIYPVFRDMFKERK